MWSKREYAMSCASKHFPEYCAVSIDLNFLLSEFLPWAQNREVWIGTNLAPAMTGIDLPARKLGECLRASLELRMGKLAL